MYSEETISKLEKRIAWKQPISSDFALEVSEDNLTGTSGKHFSSYHKLIDVSYIAATLNDIDVDSDILNNELSDIRKQAVLQVLSSVFDSNKAYLPYFDYSLPIEGKLGLFDDAIGYTVAVMIMQQYMSTTRSNYVERNALISISNLKLELNGYTNDNVSIKGLLWDQGNSIRNIVKVFFPQSITVEVLNNFW